MPAGCLYKWKYFLKGFFFFSIRDICALCRPFLPEILVCPSILLYARKPTAHCGVWLAFLLHPLKKCPKETCKTHWEGLYMFETTSQNTQRAVLLAVETGEYDVNVSLDELSELARTAGAETAAKVSQRRSAYDPATCVGSGSLEEVKIFCQNDGANLIIFDGELTASQVRNIENATGVEVIDRTTLILDIFAQRAVTSAGRLQVELAQQKYRLPRLGGKGNVLSRLGGGIGTRGPGETQLETDRRHVRRRISALEKQLKELESQRDLLRSRRKKNGVPCVAIVGYTNVGKSTLLNSLTNAGVLAEDKLFATLDPTARALSLPDGRTVMLIDTVGLVRRLPHQLVEAFHSTLEEALQADLLLNVCDVSSPDVQEQVAVTENVIRELREQNGDSSALERPYFGVPYPCK